MQEVMNHAQVEIGMRISVMPFARRSKVVVMKFRDPSSCPMQKIPIEHAHSVCPIAWPGPALGRALRGAYAVQPERGGPSPTKNAATRTQKPTNVTQKDIMLKRGKAMSSAPI